jgi:hypothetical protein
MTYAQESSRIASVRFAEKHGLTDTEPVPDGHSAAGFIRIGTAICTDPGGGTAVYGIYGGSRASLTESPWPSQVAEEQN